MYDKTTVLSTIKEYNELRRVSPRYSASLLRYKHFTVAKFILEYNTNGLKGKEVYDKLIAAIAPEELTYEAPKVKFSTPPERYSIEDLLSHRKREIPYVSNMHEPIGKLMDAAISQAVEILINHPSSSTHINYGKALSYFFNDHLDRNDIAKKVGCTKENVRRSMIGDFLEGNKYVEDISISKDFQQEVKSMMNSLLYHACDSVFDINEIDTPEKYEFACTLAGLTYFNDLKEWGNPIVITEAFSVQITKVHLKILKRVICNAIVPTSLSELIKRTQKEFCKKNAASLFNAKIIEGFINSHPWIDKDDDDRYFIQTRYLEKVYQRQGRIIFEEGGLIHHKKVKSVYEAIYGETYDINGIQSNSFKDRPIHDFLPYGKTGQWYYSEDGSQLNLPNKVMSDFIDNHIIFYWKDLADVIGQLCKVNKKLTVRRIRLEVTNLCYVDSHDSNHFVKKGEEENYPGFSWNKGKQSRTNWIINHAYELLKDAPGKKMSWIAFEKQFKDDILETGRPLKVLEDLKYKHSGESDKGLIFIREKGYISINEDVLQNDYNGDLSMVGLYRKFPEYYNILYSLAMTELRKHPDNKMLLTDFITLAVDSIESEGKVDSTFVRKVFGSNDNLPEGLSRYNEGGSVYIKLDLVVADKEVQDEVQYDVTSSSVDESQTAPALVVSEKTRQPVSYTTQYNWADVKKALQKDLAFYNNPSWLDGITSDEVLDKFVSTISNSDNYNLNHMLPQTIYEFHYARIDRYDLNQYMRNLPIAFEALLREIYDSSHRPTQSHGIYKLCEEGFSDYASSLRNKDRKGFGKILNDLVYKRNLLLHGANLELSPVTLVQNIVEYIALFVYTVNKYGLNIDE